MRPTKTLVIIDRVFIVLAVANIIISVMNKNFIEVGGYVCAIIYCVRGMKGYGGI